MRLLLHHNAFFETLGVMIWSCLFLFVVYVFCLCMLAAHDFQGSGTWFVRVANACVELLCSELYVHMWVEHTDVIVMMDNELLYDISRRSLDIGAPHLHELE